MPEIWRFFVLRGGALYLWRLPVGDSQWLPLVRAQKTCRDAGAFDEKPWDFWGVKTMGKPWENGDFTRISWEPTGWLVIIGG